MSRAPITVLPTPGALGEELAGRILRGIGEAHAAGRRFLFGSPTGRTPRPVYDAMARRLAEHPQALSHVTLVMMDEYLVGGERGLEYAPAEAPWSCHHFARAEIAARWNAALPADQRLPDESIWFPLAGDPSEYESRIADAGGVDFFLLASGASDGHVAFNAPGSARDSRTRVIPLSEATRRDNLATFPVFGTLDTVPRHGVSVGVATITEAREAVMVAWGAGKRLTTSRMQATERYDADWPATLIHECPRGEIMVDREAASR